MARSPDTYYPLLKWMIDGRVVHTELMGIGAKHPEQTQWRFVFNASEEPGMVVIGNRIDLDVSFIRGELIPHTDLSDVDE